MTALRATWSRPQAGITVAPLRSLLPCDLCDELFSAPSASSAVDRPKMLRSPPRQSPRDATYSIHAERERDHGGLRARDASARGAPRGMRDRLGEEWMRARAGLGRCQRRRPPHRSSVALMAHAVSRISVRLAFISRASLIGNGTRARRLFAARQSAEQHRCCGRPVNAVPHTWYALGDATTTPLKAARSVCG